MTVNDYEVFLNDQKATDDAARGVPPLCPDHHHPMQLVYGAGMLNDRYACFARDCHHEVELETSSLPEVKNGK